MAPKFVLPAADRFCLYRSQRKLYVRTRAFIDYLVTRFRKPFKPIGQAA